MTSPNFDSLAAFFQLFKNFESGGSFLFLLLVLFFILALSAYVKLVTVLSILRVGLGFNSLPAIVVTGSVALALSFFVMQPTIEQTLQGLSEKGGGFTSSGVEPWKKFLETHSQVEVVKAFQTLERKSSSNEQPEENEQPGETVTSWRVLVPSFVVTELTEAFQTGLNLILPLLIIDLLASIIITSLGIINLNAHVVAFPFKLLLFVMLDGWGFISTNLVGSYFNI